MEKERIAALEEAQQKEEEKLEDERKWKDMLREQMLELRDREAEVRHRYTTPVRLKHTPSPIVYHCNGLIRLLRMFLLKQCDYLKQAPLKLGMGLYF